MAELKKFADQLVGLTVKQVKELADILKEEYGIEPAAAAAPVAVAAAAAPAEAAEEKSNFNVVIKSIGDSKLQVIKAVKEITGSDLKTAKGLVETPNVTLKENAPKAEAEEIQKRLQDAGATVELQ